LKGNKHLGKNNRLPNAPKQTIPAPRVPFSKAVLPQPPVRRHDEVEVKFLVPNQDLSVLASIESYFAQKGWTRISSKNNHLLTRQVDTPDRRLFRQGTTVRVRGTCRNDNMNDMISSDICVKIKKSTDGSGALRRGEFETRIARFDKVDLKRLLKTHPEKIYPDLHKALKGVKPEDLSEFFRIDCYRDRHVIEIPQKLLDDTLGVKGKRVTAELILDDVAFVMDIPGLPTPLIYHHDLEVECEILFKPCDYDMHPDKKRYVSTPLSQEHFDKAMTLIADHIQAGAKNVLIPNTVSKAERGFNEFDLAIESISKYLIAGIAHGKRSHSHSPPKLTSIFMLSANDPDTGAPPKLHNDLPRSMSYVLRQRTIAYKR
jgi:hypothetical protein